jgi:type I restriction-modification system DNA methylase subunit
MTDPKASALVGIPEIAEIAGVGRSAVSMWRKRHPEFPLPRVDTPSGVLFDLAQVQRWLIETGKIEGIAPASVAMWSRNGLVRGGWTPNELATFVIAILVYLKACTRGRAGSLAIDPADDWEALKGRPPREALDGLRSAAGRIEQDNPELQGLIVPGLLHTQDSNVVELMSIVNSLADDVLTDEGAAVDVYEEAVARLQDYNRFAAESTTPDDLSELMVRLAGSQHSRVLDPAVGSGGVLLLWALQTNAERQVDLEGADTAETAIRLARARFFIYGVAAHLSVRDSLRTPVDDRPKADLVLLDPPMGLKDWGDVTVYTDPQWRFGPPPPTSANWAWMQLAYLALADDGCAIVALPAGAMSVRGREGRIRTAMADAGTVEAVISLPARLRRDTSIPLSLWILRRHTADRNRSVLLVDASALGTTSRSTHSLDEVDIERVVEIVTHWRMSGEVQQANEGVAIGVTLADVRDREGDLNPRPYLATAAQGPQDLEGEARELRRRFRATSEQAAVAVTQIIDRLGGPR